MSFPGINGINNSLTTSLNVRSDYLTPAFKSDLPIQGNSSLFTQGPPAFEEAIPGLSGENPLLGFNSPSEMSVTDGSPLTPFSLQKEPIIVDKDLAANSPFFHGSVASGNPALEFSDTGLVFAGSTLAAGAPAAQSVFSSGLAWVGGALAGAAGPATLAFGGVSALFPSEAGRDSDFTLPGSRERAFASLPKTSVGDNTFEDNDNPVTFSGLTHDESKNVTVIPGMEPPSGSDLDPSSFSPELSDDVREATVSTFAGVIDNMVNTFAPLVTPTSFKADGLNTAHVNPVDVASSLNGSVMMSERGSESKRRFRIRPIEQETNIIYFNQEQLMLAKPSFLNLVSTPLADVVVSLPEEFEKPFRIGSISILQPTQLNMNRNPLLSPSLTTILGISNIGLINDQPTRFKPNKFGLTKAVFEMSRPMTRERFDQEAQQVSFRVEEDNLALYQEGHLLLRARNTLTADEIDQTALKYVPSLREARSIFPYARAHVVETGEVIGVREVFQDVPTKVFATLNKNPPK